MGQTAPFYRRPVRLDNTTSPWGGVRFDPIDSFVDFGKNRSELGLPPRHQKSSSCMARINSNCIQIA